ncbi:MAG: sigma-70 family RNA polymerase sigma factor [Pseudomonadota bacterium]
MLKELSDFELVRMTKEGHFQAFDQLVMKYRKPLLHLSQRYVRDQHLAEDIVQDSLMKAYEKLSSFEFRSSFKSWIYRITINTAKNSLRSKRVNVDIDTVQLKFDSLCEITLIEKQLIEQIQEMIKGLPEKQKSAVNLRVFNDMSFKEVADNMDCPYDTAKANYRHGLLKIKEKMVANF